VKGALRNAFGIVSSSLYTLGTNVANHSLLDYDGYASSYARHVSGKWMQPPLVHVAHGVDRDLHYWKDVVNHLAPPWTKTPAGAQWSEVPWVGEYGWVQPGEQMNEEYLRLVVTEKNWGVRKAEESLALIDSARPVLRADDYRALRVLFERTLLTARLHRASAEAYFGFRVWARGESFRTPDVTRMVRDGLREIGEVAAVMRAYPSKPPAGQWEWVRDADQAMQYREWITTGWPKTTHNFANPYGGMAFGLE
jgi:hypothetical protein